MKIKETVEREVYVAPCLECGSSDILITDSNYSSFNTGGGKCKVCGHTTSAGVGCLPTMRELISIWNSGNDVKQLIAAQKEIIKKAQEEIALLQSKNMVNA